MLNKLNRAEFFALIAAILNGSIGIFTRFGFNNGLTPNTLAFWKCFGAFLLILIYCFSNTQLRKQTVELKNSFFQFSILGFLGIFCLYFFETQAFHKASIPLVSFLTYAAGGITILMAATLLKERINIYKILSFLFILFGVYIIFLFEKDITGSSLGIVFALLGGLGYALFIFMAKFFKIGSGLPQLVWLFGFGSIYLLFPLLYEGFKYPTGTSIIFVIALILLPTIGGFFFTTKAVKDGEASKVQIIETSDPLFSTLFAFIIFGDSLGLTGYIGAILIIFGLIFSMKNPKPQVNYNT